MLMPSKPARRPHKASRRAVRAAPVKKARASTVRPGGPTKGGTSGGRGTNPRAVSRRATPSPRSVAGSAQAPEALKARPLSQRELEEFRQMLEAERDRLTEELEAIEEHLPEVEQVSVDASGGYDEDLADVASDTFEREKGIAIENSVHELLQQVEEALDRIEEGTFGTCEICGQPIHPERLRALPYARLCIHCKAREEQAIAR